MIRVLRLLSLLSLLEGVALAKEVHVVATVPTLAALASEVVGDHGEVISLALHTQDPHFVDARPNLALALSRADLLVLTGLGLEVGWLPTLLTGSRNGRIQPGSVGYLDASRHVQVLQIPTSAVDRSMGDIHPGGNPHYHLDPRAARPVVVALAERLGTLDPEHAGDYQLNAKLFLVELDAAIARWQEQAQPLRGIPVIDLHRSWPYVADWLGFEIVADIEPKPGVPPTPRHVLAVIGLARERGVGLVIQESWLPSNVSRTVAEKSGARLLILDAQADFRGGQTYVQHVDALVSALVAGVTP
ncbi:MAG TPA: zinc ABC transporter substrate-binding protein [Deltaproteobacteria bacterium]|nr:zinc ABC transporter substrate-binding protein [Deltaproteobacteria bacterium]